MMGCLFGDWPTWGAGWFPGCCYVLLGAGGRSAWSLQLGVESVDCGDCVEGHALPLVGGTVLRGFGWLLWVGPVGQWLVACLTWRW